MKFSILERIGLLNILSPEGSFVTYGMIMDLRKELSFSAKEIKDYKIVEQNGRVMWDNNLEKLKEIEINDVIQKIIRKALEKLDREEKINEASASLYKRFVLQVK